MEFSATAILTAAFLAALGFSGITCASSLYNNTCHNFDIHDLEGEAGRAVRLYAECKDFNGDYVQTNLDLNTCFGWADCEFAPYDKYGPRNLTPQARLICLNPEGARFRGQELMAVSRRDFSQTCTACDNTWKYEDQFGKKFSESCDLSPRSTTLMPLSACVGYCETKDENGKQQNVASIDLGECTRAWLGNPQI